MKIKILILLLFISFEYSIAFEIKGKVSGNDEVLSFANVVIKELKTNKTSNINGLFNIENVANGVYTLKVSYVGFIPFEETIEIKNEDLELDIVLEPDNLSREDIVVTATRTKVPIHKSPIITNRISEKLFESIEAVSISEGLNFSPGLRMETNCSNCGFNQVRMNGLEGYYSQILINSRPLYSAMTGVYGLELIPANMIDRIEIVRGGGSAMYGSNAIAGTINIITKENTSNQYEINNLVNYTNFEKLENVLNFNAGFVSDDLNQGINIFGIKRYRQNWDANGDGFSQLVKIDNQSLGFDAYKYLKDKSKLKANLFIINEERRGGNKFELQPHQSDIAEYLHHNIITTSLSFEKYIEKYNTTYSIYTGIQSTDRNSYYGAGGRIIDTVGSITEEDILAMNAYGIASDFVGNLGLQFSSNYNQFTFVYGLEYSYNKIADDILGYKRELDQIVSNLGSYLQVQFELNKHFTFISGFRYEKINLDGNYNLNNNKFENTKDFNILVPRLSAMYLYDNDFKVRLNYAQGFRSPQAFDEDLHIETVGGAARFISIGQNLKPEYSDNYSLSTDKTFFINKIQFNLIVDGFYNNLRNSFILTNPIELDNGISILQKRNSEGSLVYGINFELNFAYDNYFQFKTGFTTQKAQYKQKELIWESINQDTITSTNQILRTPNNYGYLNLDYSINNELSISSSWVYTGEMITPKIENFNTEYTKLIKTKDFFELNFKLSYDFDFKYNHLIVSLGIQNILNSYQSDFDIGKNRDASYVYGPARPRTGFISFKFANI